MANIIVLGAGLGGLIAAWRLSEGGHNVTVYEKHQRTELGYPWYDSVPKKTFTDVGLNTPSDALASKQIVTYIAPDTEGKLIQSSPDNKHYDINRKILIEYLLSLIPQNNLKFGQVVDSLYVNEEKICGIVQNGEVIRADLVIDASGVTSPFRAEVPKKYLIDAELKEDDVMHSYRAYYKRNKKTDEKQADSIYLKHLGEKGLSWCKTTPTEEYLDIFIGKVNSLSEAEIEARIADLRERNPQLGYETLYEKRNILSIRYPMAVTVADGYVACGDSAFMEMPMTGSGIASALRAGYILAGVINSKKDCRFTAKELWAYQVKFMREIGSDFIMYDIIKRWATDKSNDDINMVFDSGLLSSNSYAFAKMDVKNIKNFGKDDVKKFLQATMTVTKYNNLGSDTVKALNYAIKAKFCALLIPPRYGLKTIAEWKNKYDGYVRNRGNIAKRGKSEEDI